LPFVLFSLEEQNLGHCQLSSSVGSSKIKIRTSSPYSSMKLN
jgi:hypothetical protein